jgi:predicted metal-dependent hydrolase
MIQGRRERFLKAHRAVIGFPQPYLVSRLSEAVIEDVLGRGQITRKMPYT